jgi:hypothetical protein
VTYKIVRGFRDHDRRVVVARGLTLEEAQAHCKDPETSSRTCTGKKALARTRKWGPWFDGYSEQSEEEEEKEERKMRRV